MRPRRTPSAISQGVIADTNSSCLSPAPVTCFCSLFEMRIPLCAQMSACVSRSSIPRLTRTEVEQLVVGAQDLHGRASLPEPTWLAVIGHQPRHHLAPLGDDDGLAGLRDAID